MSDDRPHFYRKPDGGYVRPIFKRDGLAKLAASVPDSGDSFGRAYGLALAVLDYVFGRTWLVRYVLDEPTNGFFGRPLGAEVGSSTVMHRVRDLAEMIVNLLPVKGVEACLDQLAAGDIEPAYAELQVGKLLHNCGIPFRFIWPSGVKRESFDVELVFPNGATACGDVKCKLETGAFSEKGLRERLDRARDQLPDNYPGMVFVKLPQDWHNSADLMPRVENICRAFLRGTRRVVCVEVFSSFVVLKDGVIHDWMQGTEFRNPKHRFGDHLDWRLFARSPQRIEPPDSWWRLTDFCKGDA